MAKLADFQKISVFKGPEQSPGFLLWRVSTSWRSNIEVVLKPLGLTHPQFVIVATLGWLTKDGERVTQIAVGKMAGLDPNTTSQIVKGLEKRGLIKRESSTDARAKNPSLTAEGQAVLAQALPAVEAADKSYFSELDEKEIGLFTQLFKKLLKQ